jgi:hypothetical protein
VMTLPSGEQYPYHETGPRHLQGYVGCTTGDGNRWQSFNAVLWHGGVDVFPVIHAGRTWEVTPGSRRLVIVFRRCVGWAWAAFDLWRQMVERYRVAAPNRDILGDRGHRRGDARQRQPGARMRG